MILQVATFFFPQSQGANSLEDAEAKASMLELTVELSALEDQMTGDSSPRRWAVTLLTPKFNSEWKPLKNDGLEIPFLLGPGNCSGTSC